MPRLLRLALLLVFISLLLIVAARLIGGMRPVMALTAIMSRPDGTACDGPCLFGIRPGETSAEEAVSILHVNPLTHDATWLNDHTLRLTGSEADIAFSVTPDGLIDSITFTDNLNDTGIPVPGSLVDSMQLGEVILAFGIPNIGLPGSNYFVTEFDNLGVTAAVARPYKFNTRVAANNPLSMVMVSFLRPCSNPIDFELHHWMGFKTFQQYMNDRKGYRLPRRFSGVPVPPYAICPK